jgi:hypothetical protein
LLCFWPVGFVFGLLDSPGLGLLNDGIMRFVAPELRCGLAGEGTRFEILRSS